MPLPEARVRALVEAALNEQRVRDAMVSVAFVGRAAMAKLNVNYLGHPGATDVISFGMGRESSSLPAVGDVYICPDVARRNARRLGIPIREELSRLVVHGTLHVTGLEHPVDVKRTESLMWRKQERILARAR
ncbi:MAG TPA: rRNA maturation RNase YbeY [Gemmatimonadaceae bacterium]|nr:rRNA maturation RNase YbeY [Gemmatimonadaceae bacterium]